MYWLKDFGLLMISWFPVCYN